MEDISSDNLEKKHRQQRALAVSQPGKIDSDDYLEKQPMMHRSKHGGIHPASSFTWTPR